MGKKHASQYANFGSLLLFAIVSSLVNLSITNFWGDSIYDIDT